MPSNGSSNTVPSGDAASSASRRGCKPAREDRIAELEYSEAGITITRVFEAPRELMWKEWTEPERFADWYGGTDGEIPLSTVSMDVREGGAWRLTMIYGGREIHWKGEYREVVEPERLVFSVSDRPDDDAFELVTVVLTDLGDGRTEMLFQQTGQMTAAQYKRAGEGWTGFFDRMADRLG